MRLRTGHAESVPGVSGLWSASHCPRPFSPPLCVGPPDFRTGHADSVPGVSGLWSASHCPRPFSPPLCVGPPDYGKNGIFKGANLRFAVENAFPTPPSSHSPANCADACSRVRPLRSTSCCPQGLVVASLLPPEIPKNFRRRVSSVKKR